MAVKIAFEVGHTSKLKSKKTPDGFTHDWELYVRGIEKTDISHYVDKVVFNLHESFPKPKRVLKDAPYILKESGYAGFEVPTEIHFKNRDQPKVMTFTYDLSLQHSGPPVHRSEIKKFTFNNPSDDFRRKLLKGGGISLVSNADEKSRDSVDERSQISNKPKMVIENVNKHKIRPEESKQQTFAKLFGTPITKTTPKVSPDAKSKSSPSTMPSITAAAGSKISKGSDKNVAASTSSVGKEKSEKGDKKDKYKHSPHKEKYEAKDIKKSDEKHERREDKKKDKSHSKERDRSRDKSSKRPLSPKRQISPKRSSPVRSSSAASRGEDTNGFKPSSKSYTDSLGLNNNSEKAPSSSSSGKKSKKEKKSYDKDRDREKKDKDRDRKEKDDRSSTNSTPVVPSSTLINHVSQVSAKMPIADIKGDYNKKAKEVGSSSSIKDATKETKKAADVNNVNDKKSSDKDSEKRHKHKKKDKNKDKEKEKDSNTSKDTKKKEKSSKKDDLKKPPQSSNDLSSTLQQKSSATLIRRLSDDDTRDSISESVSASISERHESFAESSNSSMTEIASKTSVAQHVIPDESKPDKKDRKSRDKLKVEKDERKRKRKSKDDVDEAQSHKSTPPVVHPLIEQPPSKQSKKEELIMKNGDRSNSPHLSHLSSNIRNPSPKTDDSKAFRAPTAAASAMSMPSTSSSSSSSNNAVQAFTQPDRPFTVDYIAELRDLQQKIMTLQDSNDLQQVVELIAPTGRFEITSKSFDFDLCTLDRNTVQKLQDFFATSCS